jgi:hypothetical protein
MFPHIVGMDKLCMNVNCAANLISSYFFSPCNAQAYLLVSIYFFHNTKNRVGFLLSHISLGRTCELAMHCGTSPTLCPNRYKMVNH